MLDLGSYDFNRTITINFSYKNYCLTVLVLIPFGWYYPAVVGCTRGHKYANHAEWHNQKTIIKPVHSTAGHLLCNHIFNCFSGVFFDASSFPSSYKQTEIRGWLKRHFKVDTFVFLYFSRLRPRLFSFISRMSKWVCSKFRSFFPRWLISWENCKKWTKM